MFILLSTLRDHIRRRPYKAHVFCLTPFRTVFNFFSVLHLTVWWENCIYNKSHHHILIMRQKKDQIQSCWKEFAICISVMSVKILEKASAWQVDRFGQWHPLCSHRTGIVGLSATTASLHHFSNISGDSLEASLSRVSRCFCLYVHSHLCLGCQEELSSVWDMPRVPWSALKSATALLQHRPTHHHYCLHHRYPLAGKLKRSLASRQPYELVWTNSSLSAYFILVKHLHHLAIVNLSHIFHLRW